ncbi:MAG: hypothetical protein NTV05_07810 [Acidobacteria bacterium]|nr:hypothetical protein [Acidobacteriota bacterium]
MVVGLVATTVTGRMATASPDPDDGTSVFASQGFKPAHPSFGLLPFENIDLVSGNVLLSFVDIAFPGNGLLDLTVTRSFNSKSMAWSVGPGYIDSADANADDTG